MSEDTKKKIFKKPSRRTLIVAGAVVIACGLVWIVFSLGIFGGGIGTKKVDFEQLSKDNIPQSIETEVIPEYRELERALGCLVDGKVYVVVTRGEKPTAGYSVDIEDIRLEKSKKGTNMQVHSLFKEPKEGETVSQIITYPYSVAGTDLTQLPDTIELIVKYEE